MEDILAKLNVGLQMAKAAFNKKRALLTSTFDLKLRRN